MVDNFTLAAGVKGCSLVVGVVGVAGVSGLVQPPPGSTLHIRAVSAWRTRPLVLRILVVRACRFPLRGSRTPPLLYHVWTTGT